MELVRLLVEQGADATAQDEHGWTPLHQTSERGHVEPAGFLVEQGADVTDQAKDGWTPLLSRIDTVTQAIPPIQQLTTT